MSKFSEDYRGKWLSLETLPLDDDKLVVDVWAIPTGQYKDDIIKAQLKYGDSYIGLLKGGSFSGVHAKDVLRKKYGDTYYTPENSGTDVYYYLTPVLWRPAMAPTYEELEPYL